MVGALVGHPHITILHHKSNVLSTSKSRKAQILGSTTKAGESRLFTDLPIFDGAKWEWEDCREVYLEDKGVEQRKTHFYFTALSVMILEEIIYNV